MRRRYLDSIRSLTILLVVLYHVLYMYNAIDGMKVAGPFYAVQYQDAVEYLLYPWFMVLLFIISGMSSRYYLQSRCTTEFRHSRTQKLLVPSTLGIVVFGWMQGIVNLKLGGAFETMPADMPKPVLYLITLLAGTGVLWFIQMLWLFSMILLLVRKWEKGSLFAATERTPIWLLLLLVVPFWLSSQVLNTPVVAVYRFGIYVFSFFAGYFLFAHDTIIEKLSKHCWPIAGISLVLGVLYTVTTFGQNYAVVPAVNSPLAMAYSWTACLSVLGLGKRYLDTTTPWLDFLKERSWGLYIFHYLPMSAAALWLSQSTINPILQYLICAVASLIGSLIIYEVISRTPFLRWCILGIKKKV